MGVDPARARQHRALRLDGEGMPRPVVRTLVAQPTTLCNADCGYCALPERKTQRVMTPGVARRIAEGTRRIAEGTGLGRSLLDGDRPLNLVWHCGEPTAVGVARFKALLEPFAPLVEAGILTHSIQTNATLLDENWAELFAEHGIAVGVSIDGPIDATAQRVDWAGAPLYPRILRGIEQLRSRSVPFSVIAVVGADWLSRAYDLYEYFATLGCYTLGINIEEWQGFDRPRIDSEQVTHFWEDLWTASQTLPGPTIREFNRVLNFLEAVNLGQVRPDHPLQTITIDLMPTVSWAGDVVVLSPDLLGVPSPVYGDFVIGNVLKTPFDEVVHTAPEVPYVREYVADIVRLTDQCSYFSFCCGGLASAKHFEHGTTAGGCTAHCRNGSARLLQAVLNRL